MVAETHTRHDLVNFWAEETLKYRKVGESVRSAVWRVLHSSYDEDFRVEVEEEIWGRAVIRGMVAGEVLKKAKLSEMQRLKKILHTARKKIFDSAPPSKCFLYPYDVHWAYEEWDKFLVARGITKKPNKDWPMVEGGSMEPDLYIPPDLATKMLALGHLS